MHPPQIGTVSMRTKTMRSPKQTQARRVFRVMALCLFVGGCASGGLGVPETALRRNVMDTMQSGEARLACGLSCSGTWGAARAKAKFLYENNLWEDLALQVASVGFEIDQTYFYLGRAAEELNYISAAQTYYKLALANKNKCAGIINNCDGLDVQALAKKHLGKIAEIGRSTKTELPAAH